MRLLPLAAVAVGYVLGAKAGRERYERYEQPRAAARGARVEVLGTAHVVSARDN